MGKMAHPSALSSPGSHQLPRAAPGRPGGCLHVEDGTSVCSPLPWWPPSSPGQLRAGLATAGRLHREDVPSAALPSLGGHPAPQGCSGPAGRLPASSMGKMYHRLLFPPLVATQLPRTAPGRPGGCRPPSWDVPSAALPSPGDHPAPQGCSGPATARPAAFMLGPLIHSPYKYTFSSSVMLP